MSEWGQLKGDSVRIVSGVKAHLRVTAHAQFTVLRDMPGVWVVAVPLFLVGLTTPCGGGG